MKMFTFVCLLGLVSCASATGKVFRGDPKKETAEEKSATKPLKGPAHTDNFQEEIVDQADPEFDMVSGGDGCIDINDAERPILEQAQDDASNRDLWTDEQKAENEKALADILADIEQQFKHADANGDGCVDKKEFKSVGEMEGPPPGYQKSKYDDMSEEELHEQMEQEERYEFDAMDLNGDGKVSMQEAYTYSNNNMPHADIQQQELQAMFDICDTNKDKFLTYEEFITAGQGYDGDGNEMEKAKPMDNEGSTDKAQPKDEDAKKKAEDAKEKAKPMSLKIFDLKKREMLAASAARKMKASKAKQTPLDVIVTHFGIRMPRKRLFAIRKHF